MAQIDAPFTDNQVARMIQYQQGQILDRIYINDKPVDVPKKPVACEVCNRVLMPAKDGLHCPSCKTIITSAPDYLVGGRFTMTSLTAYIGIDPVNGEEGIISMYMMPMIAADEERMKKLYPEVSEFCKQLNVEFRIVQFTTRTDITEEIKKMFGD